MPVKINDVPSDLCNAAIMVARRLQALPTSAKCAIMYAMILVKEPSGKWRLTVFNEPGRKVEEVGQ
jgi:hypothetical protein